MHLHERYVAHLVTSDQAAAITVPTHTVEWFGLVLIFALACLEMGQAAHDWRLLVLIDVPDVDVAAVVYGCKDCGVLG